MTAPPPGHLPPFAAPRPMAAISPSRFTGLETCALREVWSANRVPELLSTSPAGRVGAAAHRLLEEAGRGTFGGPSNERIAARWDELIAAIEEAMARSWLDRHLLPLSTAVPDYEVRRLRAVSRALQLAADAVARAGALHSSPGAPYGCELAVATPDGKATGRIDAVLPGTCGPIIRDYKSGAIHESPTSTDIKHAYAAQLKLYAAIYERMTGAWPERLEVIALSGEPEAVKFTAEECARVLEDAIRMLDHVNEIVETTHDGPAVARRLASPAPPTCAFCRYRPCCEAYADASQSAPTLRWPNDVWGRLAGRRVLGNGREMIVIDSQNGRLSLRDLTPGDNRHPALRSLNIGDEVGAFSMRPGGSPSSFSEGEFTVIYTRSRDQN